MEVLEVDQRIAERERLTERIRSAMCWGWTEPSEIAERLIEDGDVIVTPCKLKSRVWAAYTGIEEYYVSSIMQKSDGTLKIRLTKAGRGFVHEITENDIGDCYFLTREEAEAALAERRKA
jgi:hypothetical protein